MKNNKVALLNSYLSTLWWAVYTAHLDVTMFGPWDDLQPFKVTAQNHHITSGCIGLWKKQREREGVWNDTKIHPERMAQSFDLHLSWSYCQCIWQASTWHGVRTNNICSISVVLKKRFSWVMIHWHWSSFTKGNKGAWFLFITDCVSLRVLSTQIRRKPLVSKYCPLSPSGQVFMIIKI